MARKIPDTTTIDFETKPIEDWPNYPPEPVGVSIKKPGDKKPHYFAWGHPTKNNCTRKEGEAAVRAAYKEKPDLLFHNAKFDLDVAETHLGLAVPGWERIHDTMFLLFLHDPHATNLKLKASAEQHLGMPPEEQDILRDWCIAQKLIAKNAKEFGHLIYLAPGDLVGDYARGDVDRTRKLFQKIYPAVIDAGMGEAYDRERRLLPILLRNEHQGILVDLKRMQNDFRVYTAAAGTVDEWLRKQLKQKPGFNLDSDKQLADALINARKAKPELFLLTPTGQRSVAKDSLLGAVTDKKVLQALQYRTRLSTAVGSFLQPWMTEAENCKAKCGEALVHPSWNQVRQAGHGGASSAGARTGRISASRFLNVPKEFKERATGANAYAHPAHIIGLPELPFMRSYMLPFKGDTWCKRDYMQQELRVLGHFGDGTLMHKYSEDPTLDVHDTAAGMIRQQYNIPVTRDDTKTVGFGLLYGMGIGELAERLGVDVKQAGVIKKTYMGIFPELDELQNGLKQYARENKPLTTWGGRKYYVEPPKFMEKRGRVVTFEYKLLNYLIQGSSADCTKEAVIRYDSVKKESKFLLALHDEIDTSTPTKLVKKEMQILREVMASVEFDVPMLSDCSIGKNWGDLTKLKEPELILPPWRA